MKNKVGKKKIIISGICCAAVLVGGVSVWGYSGNSTESSNTVYKETTVEKGNLTVGVTESGSIAIGTVTQDVDYEESSSSTSSATNMGMSNSSSGSSSSAALEVEEVYITVGQEVKEGDPILKISAESIEDYRSELETAVSTASASLSEAKLSAAKQNLSASYSYDSSVANGSVAEANYNATIQELQEAIDDAQEALEEQYVILAEYRGYVQNGDDSYEDEYEAAQKKYNSLASALTKAQNNYTTKSIEAAKTYQEAMLSYNNASSQYSVDVNGIDSNISSAQDTLSEAQEALSDFNDFIGDGTIYAEYSGIITAVGYAKEDTISSGTSIATYFDADAVTMSVSVSQEDISDIAIGDTVLIELTAYEDTEFSGIVTGMDTSTSSGSSTVSYTVTVTLEGDTTGVYADMTGNVTFIQKQVMDVLYVSNKAIITEGTSSYVNVKRENGTTERVEVITGFSDGVNVEVTSGVAEGDTVLIESQVVSES